MALEAKFKGRFATKCSRKLNSHVVIDVMTDCYRVWLDPCPKYKHGGWIELDFNGNITQVYNRQGESEERKEVSHGRENT